MSVFGIIFTCLITKSKEELLLHCWYESISFNYSIFIPEEFLNKGNKKVYTKCLFFQLFISSYITQFSSWCVSR